MQGSVSMSIDFDAQFLGKIQLEANQVQEGRSRRKLDEQVEIAPGRFLPPCVGPKNPGTHDSSVPEDWSDLLPY